MSVNLWLELLLGGGPHPMYAYLYMCMTHLIVKSFRQRHWHWSYSKTSCSWEKPFSQRYKSMIVTVCSQPLTAQDSIQTVTRGFASTGHGESFKIRISSMRRFTKDSIWAFNPDPWDDLYISLHLDDDDDDDDDNDDDDDDDNDDDDDDDDDAWCMIMVNDGKCRYINMPSYPFGHHWSLSFCVFTEAIRGFFRAHTLASVEWIHCPYGCFQKIGGFPPKSSILIGFSMIFTIHFGVFPLFLETPIFACIKEKFHIWKHIFLHISASKRLKMIWEMLCAAYWNESNDSKVNFLFRLQYYNFR